MDERQRQRMLKIGGNGIRFDCPMNQFTTFRVGGNVDILYFARELRDLQQIVSYLCETNIPYLVVGKGSNLLVKDNGFRGVVIVLQGELAAIEHSGEKNEMVLAGGGLSIVELLTQCSRKGLGGLEFLSGIPGTVGGAVAMNAGAFGNDIGSMVQEIHAVNQQGDLVTVRRSQLNFSYRESSISEGTVIVKARFQLKHESPEIVAKRVADYLTRRKASQPLEYPSAGSVFKNPPNDYAGRLVEQVGLKGRRLGGAMISPKHANYIVNTGGAKAKDILTLMELAKEKVKKETGIELEPELRIVGV